jgi:hypothetical protein
MAHHQTLFVGSVFILVEPQPSNFSVLMTTSP